MVAKNIKELDLKQEVINRIAGTDFFATLPKFDSAGELISMVKEFTGGNFSINTSPLRGDNENSAKYKKLWIQNNNSGPRTHNFKFASPNSRYFKI